jgi:hypothetical protein
MDGKHLRHLRPEKQNAPGSREKSHQPSAIDQRRAELAQLDAVIRMFSPDCNPDMIPPIRPGSHGLFFSYRELPRLVLSIMRPADGPVRFDHIVSHVILAKGIEPDGHLRKHITNTTRATLGRLGARGIIRRVLDEPDTWWELVQVGR